MGSTTKHLRRADQHRSVSAKLATDDECRGWAAVVLLYAARDLVHAVFDADPDLPAVCKHPKSHTDQDRVRPGTNVVVKRHYRAFEIEYMNLYATSLGVRYEGETVDEELYGALAEDFNVICARARWHLEQWDRGIPAWLAE